MTGKHNVNVSIVINAPLAAVWRALTEPGMIKEYFFGTEVDTDWREGSQIRWRGKWQGKSYEDKGLVLKVVPEHTLQCTYWSSMSGLADIPENYKKITYELKREGSGTMLTLTQDNNADEEEVNHSAQNWRSVLEGMKKLVEKS